MQGAVDLKGIYSAYNDASSSSVREKKALALARLRAEMHKPRNYSNVKWTDIIRSNMHHSSLSPLPYSTQANAFSTYFNGHHKTSDTITAAFIEGNTLLTLLTYFTYLLTYLLFHII